MRRGRGVGGYSAGARPGADRDAGLDTESCRANRRRAGCACRSEAALVVLARHLVVVRRRAVHDRAERRHHGRAGRAEDGRRARAVNHNSLPVGEILRGGQRQRGRSCGDAAGCALRGGHAAVARDVKPRVRPFVVHIGIEILRRGEGVRDVGLRAGGVGDRPDLRAGFVLVIEALVARFRVQIHGTRGGGAGRGRLIREVERAASERARDAGIPGDAQVAGEVQGERVDGAGARDAREIRRGGIAREDDVRDLPRGDARAGDFDFVFAGRGVEGIVAEAIAGGGVGERLRQRGVGIDERERSAGLAAGGHQADANRRSGERHAARIEDDVVFARALRARRRDGTGDDMQRKQQCPDEPHRGFRSYHWWTRPRNVWAPVAQALLPVRLSCADKPCTTPTAAGRPVPIDLASRGTIYRAPTSLHSHPSVALGTREWLCYKSLRAVMESCTMSPVTPAG